MTTVVNLRLNSYDVYIGRAGHGLDGYFGNPYSVKNYGVRALPLFEEYFLKRVEEDKEFRRRVMQLKGKKLGCFCKPKNCHGDVIAKWLNGIEDSSNA